MTLRLRIKELTQEKEAIDKALKKLKEDVVDEYNEKVI